MSTDEPTPTDLPELFCGLEGSSLDLTARDRQWCDELYSFGVSPRGFVFRMVAPEQALDTLGWLTDV